MPKGLQHNGFCQKKYGKTQKQKKVRQRSLNLNIDKGQLQLMKSVIQLPIELADSRRRLQPMKFEVQQSVALEMEKENCNL
jgi:hypothetical protein